MPAAPYGETLRCERCFSPYKIVGAVEAPRKRLLCNECGHSEDVYVIARTSPATRWTLIEPSGEVRVYASQEDLLDALKVAPRAEDEPATPREPPRGALELVESERDLAARLGEDEIPTQEVETPSREEVREAETQDPPPVAPAPTPPPPRPEEDRDPGEYVSLRDVVVAPVAESIPEHQVARKSLPPPLPPESMSAIVDPPLALAEPGPELPAIDSGETLPSEDLLSDPAPVVLEADLAPPSVRAVSVPPPLPPKRMSERPKSIPPPIAKIEKKEEKKGEKKEEARSLPPKPKRPEPIQSAPEIVVDERPRVAKQVAQPEAPQQRSLLLPAAAVALVVAGGWYWYTQSNNDQGARATTAPTSETPQPSAVTPTTSATATVHEQPSASASSDITILEVASAPQTPANGGGAKTDMRSMPELLSAAGAARAKGNNTLAKELYGRVLLSSPNNVEANAGLGAIARSEGDLATARASYEKALAQSPGFYPAMLGLADTEWELGDRAGAQLEYKKLLEMPQSAPDRVRERAGVVAPKPTSAPTVEGANDKP